MKLNIYLLRSLFVALCLVIADSACSQEPKKPKIRSSANSKEIVYKPLKGRERVAVEKTAPETKATSAKQKKASAQKKTAVRKKGTVKKGTLDTKEAKAEAQQAKPTIKRAKAGAKQAPLGTKKKTNAARKKRQQSASPSSRYIALKINVPFLAVAVQNLALEVELHKHVSLDLPVMWSISDIEREHGLRTIALQPEGRWWLKSVGTGHFFGMHVHAAWFNLKWEDNRYQTGKSPLLGAGISYGYRLPLSAHWGAEFNIGAGYANMKYNTYYNIENGAQLDTRVRHYWGITRVGLSLVYRF